jgi:hypothetical protein
MGAVDGLPLALGHPVGGCRATRCRIRPRRPGWASSAPARVRAGAPESAPPTPRTWDPGDTVAAGACSGPLPPTQLAERPRQQRLRRHSPPQLAALLTHSARGAALRAATPDTDLHHRMRKTRGRFGHRAAGVEHLGRSAGAAHVAAAERAGGMPGGSIDPPAGPSAGAPCDSREHRTVADDYVRAPDEYVGARRPSAVLFPPEQPSAPWCKSVSGSQHAVLHRAGPCQLPRAAPSMTVARRVGRAWTKTPRWGGAARTGAVGARAARRAARLTAGQVGRMFGASFGALVLARPEASNSR